MIELPEESGAGRPRGDIEERSAAPKPLSPEKLAEQQAKKDEIRDIIHSGFNELLLASSKGPVTIDDVEEMQRRTIEYVTRREAQQRLPTVEGLAVAFGIDRRILYFWKDDMKHPKTHEFLQRVVDAFSDMAASAALNGSAPVVSWIFYAKNHYGYVEKSETVLTAKVEDAQRDPEEIRKRWLAEGQNLENAKDVNENDDIDYEVK